MGHGLNNTIQDVLIRFERMRGRRGALAPGHRPRRHRHPERGRAAARQGGQDPLRPRPRGVRGAGLGLRRRDRRRHPRAAPGHRRARPTGPGPTSPSTRGSRRAVREVVRAAVREGPDLPRQVHHQLVPPLPHRALQRGGGEGGDRRAALAPPLSARRRRGHITVATTRPETMLGDTAVAVHPEDDALPRPDRQRAPAAAGRPADPDRGRRGGGPGLRHRRRQGDAGARSRRLRDRPAARPRRAST